MNKVKILKNIVKKSVFQVPKKLRPGVFKQRIKRVIPVSAIRQKVSKFRLVADRFQKYNIFKNRYNYTYKMFKFIHSYKEDYFHGALKYRLSSRLENMRMLEVSDFVPRNIRKKTYFFGVLRRALRKKSKLRRSFNLKPFFSKRNKYDRLFLYRARRSLIGTKKYLYKKKFPKIRGKKNKNFNFAYYNNIERSTLKFFIGRLVITYLHNNTFINIHDSKKMLRVFSAGKLGFKGPKRSTPYSRQIVARKAVKFLMKSKINVLDIYLNSNYNRWYYFLIKEFSKPRFRPYAIRYLVSNNPKSHGFLRNKKHRRK